MASNYPGSLDSFDTIAADKKTSEAVGGRTHRAMHNDLGDAIEAVQAELGTTPSGSYATVKARFEAIEGSTLPQVDAKGDLIVGTADNTYDNLGVGTNDTVLLAASGETKGVKWAQVPTAGIADDAVTAAKIAADAVGSSEIAAGAVGTSELADAAVTAAKLGSDVRIGNLLTLNQASGASTSGIGVGGTTLARVSDALGYDGYAIEVTKAGAGNGYVVIGGASDYIAAPYTIPCRPGEIVSATVDVWSPSDTQTATLKVRFKDAGGGSIVTYDMATTLSTSVKTLRNTLVAPANTAYVLAYVEKVQAGSGSESFRYSRASIHKGAAGQWALPGTPVVGQSHIATNGALHLSGTGSPEGVVPAAPGSTWLQTDATTDVKGWIRWIKATGTGNTGWIAGPEADTGRRDVTASIDADWQANTGGVGYVRLQRVGERVYFEARLDRITASGGRATFDTVYTAPAGFVPRNAYNIRGLAYGPAGVAGFVGDLSTPGQMQVWFPSGGTWAASDDVFFTAEWYTADAWPSSLPGSAA